MTDRGVVIVRVRGGLGNQMFQYAAGRALALRHKADLRLDTHLYQSDPLRQYGLHHFRIVEQFPAAVQMLGVRLAARRPFASLNRALRPILPGLLFQHVKERDLRFDPTVLNARGRIYLNGYWQTERYFADCATLIRQELSFKEPPDPADGEWVQRITECCAVCVHVRRGDYVTNPRVQAMHGPTDLDYYRRAMDLIVQRVGAPTFTVFSDDPDWSRRNLRPPGPTLWVSPRQGRPDCEDLRLMTHCRHFIIANSSFSWWGAWLAKDPSKIVIAPRQWFATPQWSSEDKTPADWLRL